MMKGLRSIDWTFGFVPNEKYRTRQLKKFVTAVHDIYIEIMLRKRRQLSAFLWPQTGFRKSTCCCFLLRRRKKKASSVQTTSTTTAAAASEARNQVKREIT